MTGLSYVKLTSVGIPTLDSNYACIADGSTGYVWSRYGIEAADLSSDLDDDSDLSGASVEYMWGASPDAHAIAVNKLRYCGRADWTLPTITDLLEVSDYEWLGALSPLFEHIKYWSSEACWVDADGITLGHWAYDFASGASDCLADTVTLEIRAVSKN